MYDNTNNGTPLYEGTFFAKDNVSEESLFSTTDPNTSLGSGNPPPSAPRPHINDYAEKDIEYDFDWFPVHADNSGNEEKYRVLESIYDLLPSSLEQATRYFSRRHEKDVFLVSLFGTLSAGLPNLYIQYGSNLCAPHLFVYILAPAASGKGAARHAFNWLDSIDNQLREQSRLEQESWHREKESQDFHKSNKSKKSKESNGASVPPSISLGDFPEERCIVVAGNTTSAALAQRLAANQNGVFIGCTEGDTLTGANRGEHGRFSHILRGAFHHEQTMVDRKGDGSLRIPSPKIALVLTGTPDQFPRFLEHGVEDGLFSRFGIYSFNEASEFESQRPTEQTKEINQFTKDSAEKALRLYNMLVTRTNPLDASVSEELWAKMDSGFKQLHDLLVLTSTDELVATVKRGTLIAFRIAMISAAWRAFDSGQDLKELRHLEIGETDITIGRDLGLLLCQHAIRAAENVLPSRKGKRKHWATKAMALSNDKQKLISQLPMEFKTKDILQIGDDMGIPKSTIFSWLESFVTQGILSKERHGTYQKM